MSVLLEPTVIMQVTNIGFAPTATFNDLFNQAGRPAAELGVTLGQAIHDKYADAAARQQANWPTMDAFLAAIQPALDAAEQKAFGAAYLMAIQGVQMGEAQ